MSAISTVSTASTAYAELRKYQQKLSSDQSAADCATGAVNEDIAAIGKAKQAIRQVDESAESIRPRSSSTGRMFDVDA